MPLWGSVDNAANSDIAAVIQFNKGVTSANQTTLFGNTTTDDFIVNEKVGQFGVDTNEMQAAQAAGTAHPAHAGWSIRHEGTGLKAGRVWYETLVAMGSMSSDAEDTVFKDTTIVITTQPTSNTAATRRTLNFTVVASSTPSATLSYKWQKYNGSSWVDVPNTSGQYLNNTSPTFTANNQTANGNVFRVLVSATGATSVPSGNATISYIV